MNMTDIQAGVSVVAWGIATWLLFLLGRTVINAQRISEAGDFQTVRKIFEKNFRKKFSEWVTAAALKRLLEMASTTDETREACKALFFFAGFDDQQKYEILEKATKCTAISMDEALAYTIVCSPCINYDVLRATLVTKVVGKLSELEIDCFELVSTLPKKDFDLSAWEKSCKKILDNKWKIKRFLAEVREIAEVIQQQRRQ